MGFDINSPFLFFLVAVILCLVLTQSIYFMIRAWKQAKELGIDTNKLKGVVRTSIVFTLVPAFSILIGVIALSKKLGLPLPWLRLSVVGAITYETPAAEAASQAVGTSMKDVATSLTAVQYSTIAWIMTLGIMAGVILTPILCKRLLGGVSKFKDRDNKWGDILMSALFVGMISAFLGMIFGHVQEGLEGWIPVFVMGVSAATMLLCAFCIKKLGWKWMQDYALPISMIASMILAIPITNAVMQMV
ncbi:MAG: DUF5058 family protein [Peptostreptococcaceae bacterium]|nr:DUF5058 family protein [Peptostreptococcaceae bacterium]